MPHFFTCAVAGLRKENNLLAEALRKTQSRGLYPTWSTGVSICWEQHLAYLAVRSCLLADFPTEIGWEEKYPTGSGITGPADLVVKTTPWGVIEMKYCRCDPRTTCPCPRKVHADYDKLLRWSDVQGYLFLVWNDLHEQDHKARRMTANCNLRQASGTQTEYLEGAIFEPWGVKGGRMALFTGLALFEAIG
jgi:hypothetical protein